MTLSSNSSTLSVAWQGSGTTSSRIIDFTQPVMRSARPLCTDKLKLRKFNNVLSVRKPVREELGHRLHRLVLNHMGFYGDICCIEAFSFLWKMGLEPVVRKGEKSEGVMRSPEERL